MGKKFKQAQETIHIAVELIDQFYLKQAQDSTSEKFRDAFLLPSRVILHQIACLLIASKYDEIDDNIISIRDLRSYF